MEEFLQVETAKIEKPSSFSRKRPKDGSQMSSRALVTSTEGRRAPRNRFLGAEGPEWAKIDQNGPSKLSKIKSKIDGLSSY